MDLARHSSYAMTARYSHSRFYDLAAAVNGLPSLVPEGHAPEALAATGTDGNLLGPFLGPQRDILAHNGGQSGMEAAPADIGLSTQKTPENLEFSGVSSNSDKSNPNWRRRELNPRLGVLQRSHLRV